MSIEEKQWNEPSGCSNFSQVISIRIENNHTNTRGTDSEYNFFSMLVQIDLHKVTHVTFSKRNCYFQLSE